MKDAALSRLKLALKHKERELSIEASLEKVRVIALAMKKRSDMASICKVISTEMAALGVMDIRNVQTAIFDTGKGTYMNYEFYVRARKSLVSEGRYDDHPMIRSFTKRMLAGKGRVFSETLKGKEVMDWLEFQKTTKQYADPHLAKVDALQYNWFSLGSMVGIRGSCHHPGEDYAGS